MLIIRKRLIPGARVEEGLRLSAAMLGMDHPPVIVFLDDGIEVLFPEALYKNNLKDYLKVISDLVGVYVLKESLIERGLTEDDLEQEVNATSITFNEIADMAKDCNVITSF